MAGPRGSNAIHRAISEERSICRMDRPLISTRIAMVREHSAIALGQRSGRITLTIRDRRTVRPSLGWLSLVCLPFAASTRPFC